MSGELNNKNIAKRILDAANAYHDETIPTYLNDGYFTIFFSEDNKETSVNQTRSTTIINRDSQDITIAISGTRADQGAEKLTADLCDDMQLASGAFLKTDSLPAKLAAIKAQNLRIMNAMLNEAVDKKKDYKELMASYKFNFTGHSLGAALSDLAAADMYLKLRDQEIKDIQISSISFDNPGAKSAVQTMLKEYNKNKPKDKQVTLDDLRENISYKAINNSKNFINTMDGQISQKYRIIQDGQKQPSAFQRMCGYLANKCYNGSILRKVFTFLSFGRVKNQVQSHSLENFKEVIVENRGKIKHKGVILSVDDIENSREPIKYDKKIFTKLSEPQWGEREPSVGEQQFVMVDPKDSDKRVVVNEAQIIKALGVDDASRELSQPKKKNFVSRVAAQKTRMSLFTAMDVAQGKFNKRASPTRGKGPSIGSSV